MTPAMWLAAILMVGGGGVLVLIGGGWFLDWLASRPIARPVDVVPTTDELPGWGGAPLPPAPAVVIRTSMFELPMDPPRAQIEERTEEMPALVEAEPVEHHGADEEWSPTQELELVPARSLDPWEAIEAEIEAEVRAEFAAILDPIQQQIARLGHAEQHTCEISFEQLRLAVAAVEVGAR